jgi:hypothetical protein
MAAPPLKIPKSANQQIEKIKSFDRFSFFLVVPAGTVTLLGNSDRDWRSGIRKTNP